VSATTRRPRPGETHGVDYWFLSDEEFDERVRAGEFVEHAEYSGRRYGTLRSELETRGSAGRPVVLEIEVQGARQIHELDPDALLIFVTPPSAEEQERRLRGRGDPDEIVRRRLAKAAEEATAAAELGAVEVVNDDLERCVEEVAAIIASARV
jgi:guanylate kinase